MKMKKDHKLKGNSYIPQKELAEALKANFPSVFADGKVDCEKLKLALDEDYQSANEKYGLSWTGKSDCFREIQTGTTATLKPNKNESVDFEKTDNIFIEGDNLEALKVLQRSYYGKIKCIYIDPPYNTGNDFIYNDNFRKTKKEELEGSGEMDGNGDLTRADGLSTNRKDSNGHFHSDWLNMMYPRLFLARNLLRQDGVIFVSIDDNEVHNLRMIMNEIFGEENFVGTLKWKKKKQPSYMATHIAGVMEYILVYSRDINELEKLSVEKRSDMNTRVDNAGNDECVRTLPIGVRVKLPEEIAIIKKGIYKNKSMQTEFLSDVHIENGRIKNKVGIKARFRNSQEQIDFFAKKDVIFITKNFGLRRDLTKEELEIRKTIKDLLLDWGDNQESDKEIKGIFPENKFFEYPKPTKLIKNLIKSVFSENDIILDFFAGSGTTAQAVMEQNAEDGGNRKWICVQLPEVCDEESEAFKAGYKNIAEIAKERIRRAGKKIIADCHSRESGNPVDVGFKSLKLDKSNFKIWQGKFKDEKDLLSALDDFVDNLEKRSNKENILYELILKSGLELNVLIEEKEIEKEKYFDLENGKLFIYLGENISIKMAEKFIEMKPEKIICLERAFQSNDELKTNILLQAEQEDIDFKVI